jgi:dipeptidase E
VSGRQTIVAMGGLSWVDDERRKLEDYFLGLADRDVGGHRHHAQVYTGADPRPRVLFVPTAVADDAEATLRAHAQLGDRAQVSHLPFFPWPPSGLRELVLRQDVVYVSGGNTANALAIWRAHGFDRILREAWEAGIVLTGWSAGMICWFEASVTDSFSPELDGMRDGLGFLPGSACPHYDCEERRRPVYASLVASGFPPGVAAEDCVALRFDGTELAEVVSARPGSRAYRVTSEGEQPLEARVL